MAMTASRSRRRPCRPGGRGRRTGRASWVDREPLQVVERGVAGAEVVDGDPHALLLQARASVLMECSAFSMATLSVISRSSRRRRARSRRDAADLATRSACWNWRRERLTATVGSGCPACQLRPGAGRAQHPLADRHDQPGSSATGMNSPAGPGPLRMAPAQERLRAEDRPCAGRRSAGSGARARRWRGPGAAGSPARAARRPAFMAGV